MIRLDHDGHETSRDPEPMGFWDQFDERDRTAEQIQEAIRRSGFRVHHRGGGGYWDRLHEDIRQAQQRR